MTNNITAQPGTETPIPCKPLVAILGWAMELQHTLGAHALDDTNEMLFETFIGNDNAYMAQDRRDAIMFRKEIKELCTVLAGLTPEETKALNEYLLSVCQEQMKKTAA
ncbi:MAG TPA: hypothetical protein PKH16_10040 [Aequorivita sp.]|nr:hypothetical protein [Aequorivita sp.]